MLVYNEETSRVTRRVSCLGGGGGGGTAGINRALCYYIIDCTEPILQIIATVQQSLVVPLFAIEH